jgi:hypothetical protein
VGAIVLAALADGTSVTTAMVVGGIACAVAAPLYIPAFRAERDRRRARAAPAPTPEDRVTTEMSDSPV